VSSNGEHPDGPRFVECYSLIGATIAIGVDPEPTVVLSLLLDIDDELLTVAVAMERIEARDLAASMLRAVAQI